MCYRIVATAGGEPRTHRGSHRSFGLSPRTVHRTQPQGMGGLRSINGATPKMMVFLLENPISMDDLGGTPIYRHLHFKGKFEIDRNSPCLKLRKRTFSISIQRTTGAYLAIQNG